MLDDLAWFPLAAPCMRRHYGPWRSPRGPYPRYRKTQYLGSALFLERPRARIERATSRHYMIYQQNAEVVNLQAFAGGVGATYRFSMFVAREHPLQRARPGAGVDGVVLGHTTPGGVAANVRKTTDPSDLERLYRRPFSFFSWQVMQ